MSAAREFVIVVSGLPRSGTSLMMQMLAAGGLPVLADQLRAADLDNPRGYYEFEVVKQTKNDASWLQGAAGKAVKMVHLLLYDLPPGRSYQVLFLRRRLEEVVASQRAMLRRQGKPGAALPYEQLLAIFRKELDRIARWLAVQPGFAVLDVDYNALITDPADSAQRVDEFLGGGLDVPAMVAAVDPNLYRQRGNV